MVIGLEEIRVIKVNNLAYSIDNKRILKEISLEVKKNKFVGIIGANGCGKSTLLKNIYRFLKYDSGNIKVEDKDITEYSGKDLAKKISVLIQKQNMNFDFTVQEIIEMGRYARHENIFETEDRSYIKKYLSSVGMEGMEKRSFLSLSGGEMQRVFIARALSQETNILILDEPTNHLDLKYQIEIMNLIKKQEKTVLSVIHDMNIASKYCDYVVALKDGKVMVNGDVEKVFTKENIKEIFDIDCEVIKNPKTQKPLIIF